MAYTAVIEARKAAEAKKESVRDAVRFGLQLMREAEAEKASQELKRAGSLVR